MSQLVVIDRAIGPSLSFEGAPSGAVGTDAGVFELFLPDDVQDDLQVIGRGLLHVLESGQQEGLEVSCLALTCDETIRELELKR